MEDDYLDQEAIFRYLRDHKNQTQVVPFVVYIDRVRVVLGQAEVTNGMFSVELADDIPPKIKDMIGDKDLSSFSAADVFDRDTPIFPANAYSVNAPLAEDRLRQAILGVRSPITEGEA